MRKSMRLMIFCACLAHFHGLAAASPRPTERANREATVRIAYVVRLADGSTRRKDGIGVVVNGHIILTAAPFWPSEVEDELWLRLSSVTLSGQTTDGRPFTCPARLKLGGKSGGLTLLETNERIPMRPVTISAGSAAAGRAVYTFKEGPSGLRLIRSRTRPVTKLSHGVYEPIDKADVGRGGVFDERHALTGLVAPWNSVSSMLTFPADTIRAFLTATWTPFSTRK